jgi:hypothetical protein
MLNMHRPPHVLPTMNANVLHTQDRLPRWHHLVAGLRHRQATRPLVMPAAVRCSPSVCVAYINTSLSLPFTRPLHLSIPNRDRFMLPCNSQHTPPNHTMRIARISHNGKHKFSHRTGHSESLHITLRNPALSFSSRAKKTNKGSPPPSSRAEVYQLCSR